MLSVPRSPGSCAATPVSVSADARAVCRGKQAYLTITFRPSTVQYLTREELKQSISFQLNPDCGVPAYLQLPQQVKQALRMGILEIGDKLPTVKEVVAEVAVNSNTVMKAYWQLEHEGLVEGRQGVGTFVEPHEPRFVLGAAGLLGERAARPGQRAGRPQRCREDDPAEDPRGAERPQHG